MNQFKVQRTGGFVFFSLNIFQEECRAFGGYAVYVDNNDENEWLKNFVRKGGMTYVYVQS